MNNCQRCLHLRSIFIAGSWYATSGQYHYFPQDITVSLCGLDMDRTVTEGNVQ